MQVLISPAELESLIRNVFREELAAAGNQSKEKVLMNFNETIQFLGISRSTLNIWKSQGRLPYKKLGKRIFFNQQEILDALEDSNYSKLKKLRSEK